MNQKREGRAASQVENGLARTQEKAGILVLRSGLRGDGSQILPLEDGVAA